MAKSLSWLWQKTKFLWILLPFGLAIALTYALVGVMDDNEFSVRQKGGKRLALQLLHEKPVSKTAGHHGVKKEVKGGRQETAPIAAQIDIEKPFAGAEGATPDDMLPEYKRLGMEQEYVRRVKLEDQKNAAQSMAEELSAKIHEQQALASQLAAKLAAAEAEREREMELRTLAGRRLEAEQQRQDEAARLEQIRRIAEETRQAREKMQEEQKKIEHEKELDRVRMLAEQEKQTLALKLKQEHEEESKRKEEQARQLAQEKLAKEMKNLEDERVNAQKLRFEREKALLTEQLKVEELKAKIAARERLQLEKEIEREHMAIAQQTEARVEAHAQEKALLEAQAQAREQALEQARQEAQVRAQAQAEVQARQQALEQAREQTREQALELAREQLRQQAREQAQVLEQARKQAHEKAKAEEQALVKARAQAKAEEQALVKARAQAKAEEQALAKARAQAKDEEQALAKAQAKAVPAVPAQKSSPQVGTVEAVNSEPGGLHAPQQLVDTGLRFVNIGIAAVKDKLAVRFDLLKTSAKIGYFEGDIVAVGKYQTDKGETLFVNSVSSAKQASKEEIKARPGAGLYFKVKRVVSKKVEINLPPQGKLLDVTIIARDAKGRNIGSERLTKF